MPFGEEDMYDAQLEVARIYLKYCGNGDLKRLETHYAKEQILVPEEYVWRTFLCLFKGFDGIRSGK